MEFVLGGAAAVGACFFTNPMEVLKTRMQLQGELQAKGQHAVHYRNVLHAAYTVIKNDGVLALQNGLVPALYVQLVLNGLRIGTFQYANVRGYIHDENGEIVFYKSVAASGTGGILGGFFCSPLFMIKTHLQSQAAAAVAVGHQHHHDGMYSALKKIWIQNGIRGLFRGAGAALPRVFVGSTAQLTSSEYMKLYLSQYKYFDDKPILKSFVGSMVGGVAISIAITPFDLIATRIYNQPTDDRGKGKVYTSYLDCVRKIYKSEGLSAFYKGVGPMYLRLGPHTVLCLMFFDQLKTLHDKYFADPSILS